MPQLRVKDYAQVFLLKEAFRHPEVSWTKWPVARAGLTFRTLMASVEGQTAYCVFNGIIRLVSRYKTGGMLSISGRDMTPADVSVDSGIPLQLAEAGWKLLQHHGWIEPVPDRSTTGETTASERRGSGVPPSIRQEERRERTSAASAPGELDFNGAGAREVFHVEHPDSGGGGELPPAQGKALQALLDLGVRPSKARMLVAAHEPEAIHEGIKRAKATDDDKPKAGLAVSWINSGDAARALEETKAASAGSLGASVMRLMKAERLEDKKRVLAWAHEFAGVECNVDEVIKDRKFLRWLGQREDVKRLWDAAKA